MRCEKCEGFVSPWFVPASRKIMCPTCDQEYMDSQPRKEKFGIPYSIEECITYKQRHLKDADPYLLELFQWLINMATVGDQALKEAREGLEEMDDKD